MIFVVQFALSIILFLITNWIGKNATFMGYTSISFVAEEEGLIASNYLIRVASPLVYLIVISTIFYYFGLDNYVKDFYFVSIYYVSIRIVFNIVMGRVLLIGLAKLILYNGSIIVFSYLLYTKLISNKENILPDPKTMVNELWILIILFFVAVINKVQVDNKGIEKRNNRYCINYINRFSSKYGELVDRMVSNDQLKSIVYAIMIYENFNRPAIVRLMEKVCFIIDKKPRTLGIMQVYTQILINNEKSVEIGIRKILDAYNMKIEFYNKNPEEYDDEYDEYILIHDIIYDYNSNEEYCSVVANIRETVMEILYPNTTDRLFEPSFHLDTRPMIIKWLFRLFKVRVK
jgi:hypothetical protein